MCDKIGNPWDVKKIESLLKVFDFLNNNLSLDVC